MEPALKGAFGFRRNWLALVALGLGLLSPLARADVPSGTLSLASDATRAPLTSSELNGADSVIVLIHGWTGPDSTTDQYTTASWTQLITTLRKQIDQAPNWGLVVYNWEKDSATGKMIDISHTGIPSLSFDAYANASSAAENARANGDRLASLLNSITPKLRKIMFIAHSAGAWAAYEAITELVQLNPKIKVSLVLLDPFVPGAVITSKTDLTNALMSGLSGGQYENNIFKLENYYSIDMTDDVFRLTSQVFKWGTQDVGGYQVDWYNILSGSHYADNFSWLLLHLESWSQLDNWMGHFGPIWFYSDTVNSVNNIGSSLPGGLDGAPYVDQLFQLGWWNSMFMREPVFYLSGQPKPQSAAVGAEVAFSGRAVIRGVAAGAYTYQWFRNGQSLQDDKAGHINGAGPVTLSSGVSTLALHDVTAADAGQYTLQATTSEGLSNDSPTAALTITGTGSLVAPTQLTATAVSSSQINLSWTGNSVNETGFYLYQSQSASGPWTLVNILPATTLTYAAMGLSASTPYYWRVQAYNASGQSDYSAIASTTTQAAASAARTLTIQSSNPASGVTVYYDTATTSGSVTTPASPQSYSANTAVHLFASDPVGSNHFIKWQEDGVDAGASTILVVTMDTGHTVTAIYGAASATRTLTGLTINGQTSLNEGTTQPYTATAGFSDGSTLAVTPQWSVSPAGAPASISASGALTAGAVSADTAVTVQASYTSGGVTQTASLPVTIINTGTTATQIYKLSIYQTGQGSVGRVPNQNQFQSGAQVNLEAYPGVNYTFSGWGGDAASFGTQNPINLTMDGNKSVTANFVSDASAYGAVNVTIAPQGAAAAGGQWQLDNSGPWHDSGVGVTITANASHTITYLPVPGYTTPASQTFTAYSNGLTDITGTYVSQTGSGGLQVTLQPQAAVDAGAQWRVQGGSGVWQNSGATLGGLWPGSYLIEFKPVAGWSLPSSPSVAVVPNSTGVATATYGPPVTGPVIYSIGPQTGPLAGGTDVTIAGANFLAPVSVTFGVVSATQVQVVSATQIIARTPVSKAYHTVPVAVTAAGGTASSANGFTYIVPRGSHMDLVGQLGGAVRAVEAQGNYLYTGEGSGLVVYDISNPASPAPVGRLALPGMVNDLAIEGTHAYVADGDGGVYVVDISTPASPVVQGFYNTPSDAQGIAVQAGIAYVADYSDFAVLDCSDPTAPVLRGSINPAPDNLGGGELMTVGNSLYACVSGGSHLVVIDVTNPASPSVLTKLDSTNYEFLPHDLAVVGSKVYFPGPNTGTEELEVYDFSTPSAPALVAKYNAAGDAIAFNGSVAYLANGGTLTSFNAGDFSGSLENIEFPAYINQITIVGNYAYLATNDGGLQVVSIASPSNMTVASKTIGAFDVEDIALNGPSVYEVGGPSGFNVINATDPASLQYAGHLDLASEFYGKSLANSGTTVFVGGSSLGIAVVQTDQASPQLVSTYTKSFYDVKLSCDGNLLYVAGGNTAVTPWQSQFLILNFSNPSALSVQGQISDSAAAAANFAYCAIRAGSRGYFSDGAGVHVVDLSNISNPVRMGDIPTLTDGLALAVTGDGNHLLVANGVNSATQGIAIVDVTDGNHPVVQQTILSGQTVSGITVVGSLAYIAGSSRAVSVMDISDLTHPVVRASYGPLAVWPNSVRVAGDLVYVADAYGGLVVLRLLDYTPPTITMASAGSTLTNTNGVFSVSGQANDDRGVTQVVWADSLGGSGTATGTTAWQSGNIVLQPGANVLTFTASDAAGNTSSATVTVNYTPLDTTPPVVNITAPTTAGNFPAPTTSVTLQGTASDNSGTVASVAWANDRGGSGTATGTATWSVANLPLALGPNDITITATDPSGNTSTAKVTVTYEPPDTTPPAVAISFPTGNASYATENAQLDLAGTASDDRHVAKVNWASNQGGSGVATGTTTWSVNGIALSPGLNVITATAQDDAGNSAAVTLAVTYTPPVAPTITTQPAAKQTTLLGGNVSFAAVASGVPAPAYQWQVSTDGGSTWTNLTEGGAYAGTTTGTLTLTGVTAAMNGDRYRCVATNSVNAATSNGALLAVTLPSYTGDYFSTAGSSNSENLLGAAMRTETSSAGGASWALAVNATGAGEFILYAGGTGAAVVTPVTIQADGSFTATGTTLGSGGAAYTLSGQINPDGTVSATVSGLNETLTGAADTASAQASQAGYYSAKELGASSGTAYAIVGPSGKAQFVVVTGNMADGGTGTMNSTGALTATSSAGAQIAATFDSSSHSITLSVTPAGSTTPTGFAGVSNAVTAVNRLVNISTRGYTSTGDQLMIAGFVVGGSTPKQVLIRAVGPALSAYGVNGVLPHPVLTLFSGSNQVASNAGWSTAANAASIATVASHVGAFALSNNSADSSLLVTLNPGTYTAQVTDVNNASGVVLVEVYEADTSNASPHLVNISTRGQVNTGGDILIGGFVVSGNAPKQVLIRAVGPGLAGFGVAGVLSAPQLTVFSGSTAILTNTGWSSGSSDNTAAIQAVATQTGAFPLTVGSADCAVLATLNPGAYTVQVSGVNSATGIALIEVYEIPAQ